MVHSALACADTLVANPLEAVKGILQTGGPSFGLRPIRIPLTAPKETAQPFSSVCREKKYLNRIIPRSCILCRLIMKTAVKTPTHGRAQSWPARRIAITDKAKIYLWPGSQAEEWKTMERDLLKVLVKKEEQ